MKLESVTLRGQRAQLEPLNGSHAAPLFEAAQNSDLQWFFESLQTRSETQTFIENRLAEAAKGDSLPFMVRDLAENRVVGTTSFLDFSPQHRAIEIGATFLDSSVWRTRINTEAKWLLLTHCFQNLDLVRVFFKTDARNVRSQRAIERLGAVREGVLRKHRVLPDGFIRDSVFYSILDDEWPAVKARLDGFLRI